MAATCEQLTAADLQSLAALQHISAPMQLADEAAGPAGAADMPGKGRRISALAYSGEPVQREFGTMVIDLGSIRLSDKRTRLPMLMRHSTGGMCDELQDSRLGHWDKVTLNDSGVYLSGELYDKPIANQVLEDARKGYPWEISVGLTDGNFERIPAGEKRTVNGRELLGTPVNDWGGGGTYIMRNARLREASLVEIGADPNTQASFELSAQRMPLPQNFKARAMQRFHAILAGLGIPASTVREALDLDLDTNGVAALAASPSGASPMSTPTPAPVALAPELATIEQLEALPGADDAFVLAAVKAKLTIGDACQKLLAVTGEKLKALTEQLAAKDAEIKALGDKHAKDLAELDQKLAAANRAGGEGSALKLTSTGGEAASTSGVPEGMRQLAGVGGKDPEADWKNSEELREHYKDRGGKATFLRVASMSKASGEDYRFVPNA